jgi:hypothetical protein
MNDSRPPLEDLPDGVLSANLDFARERRIRSAHYVGNADRALIEGLAGIVGKDALSLMDMPDRWKTGFAFWWDEREFPGFPCSETPEWLEGISCYQEGGPDETDLMIWEAPWHRPAQMLRVIAFRRSRGWRPFPQVALLGAAREIRLPGIYSWRTGRGYDFGVLRDSVKAPRKPRPGRHGSVDPNSPH